MLRERNIDKNGDRPYTFAVKNKNREMIEYLTAIELYSYMDLQELRWKRKKYLSIASAIEDYSDLLLVWYAKAGKLLLIDLEHEQETELCGWEEFIKAPGVQLNKIFV